MNKWMMIGLILSALVYCAKPVTSEETLIGDWIEAPSGIKVTFLDDGTGATDLNTFQWSFESNLLIMTENAEGKSYTNTVKTARRRLLITPVGDEGTQSVLTERNDTNHSAETNEN